jgi:hypothetical protein
MPPMRFVLDEAKEFLADRTPAPASVVLWDVLAKNPGDARAWELMGQVAEQLGDPDAARFHRVAAELRREPGAGPPASAGPGSGGDRYLVIKAWGFGFWSDMDMMLGGLLLAEMCGRIPVTFWGRNSLFTTDPTRDAFTNYFEPVSSTTVDELLGRGHDFYPPKWNEGNLKFDPVDKIEGPYVRFSGLNMLNRPERIAVLDQHTPVYHLLPWIRAGHPLFGAGIEEAYRYLFAKYCRPVADIREQVQVFVQSRLTQRPVIAVHARGTDKPREDPQHPQRLALYPQAIEHLSRQAPNCPILLLTDSEVIAREYTGHYPKRLVLPPAIRTSLPVGLHYLVHQDRRRLGIEVVRDVFLAAACDLFVGVGTSNIGCAIYHAKAWAPGSTVMLSHIMFHHPPAGLAMNWEQLEKHFSADWVATQKKALREAAAGLGPASQGTART